MVREALFNMLGEVDGLRVLDLFAGTGALAFEAISRGAAHAILVEKSPAALRAIEANAATLGFEERVRVMRLDVTKALKLLAKEEARFHLVFLDPPYGAPAGSEALRMVAQGDLLEAGAIVVMEHDIDTRPPEALGCLQLFKRRKYGRTELSLYTLDKQGALS